MKVFHIISHLDVGGAERVAISIAQSQTNGCCHHIVELQRGYGEYTRELISELQQSGIPFHRSAMPVFWHFHYLIERLISLLFPLRMLWLWLRYRPDVVHTHTEMPDMALWAAVRMFPFMHFKVVRTIHNTCLWTGMEWIGPRVERFMQMRGANVAISPNVQNAYVNKYGGCLPPVIYNGVSPVSQRTYKNIIEGKTNIIFAGRFEEQKGIAVLCRIVKALQHDSRYHFHIFGSGSQQALVDELNALPNATVHAPLHGISAFMASFDFLIMPSLHEGLSILAIEASMNGLPLIFNRCDGLTDTLPPQWPLAVTNNELGQWEEIFRGKLPKIDRQELVEMARTYVEERFSTRQMQSSYEKIYKAL